MNKTDKKYKLEEVGIEIEIGKFARQADGAVFIRHKNNVILSTAVASKEKKEFMGFFPLMVEYRERVSAAGKFPGGFIKREGRLSDKEVLGSRLIDRPIRPLFPYFYFKEVQLLSTVFSSDGKFPTDVLALIGSSLALTIAPNIPFLEPIGAVRVGRIDGKWKFNLGGDELEKSDVNLVVAGTKNGLSMVEGYCDGLSEKELVEALFLAHKKIRDQVEWQLEIQKDLGVPIKIEEEDKVHFLDLKEKVQKVLPKDFTEKLFVLRKKEQSVAMDSLKESILENFAEQIKVGEVSKTEILLVFDIILKEVLPDIIAKRGRRFDNRKFDQIRPLRIEVGLLPCVHGSALFQRGETQSMVSITLGTAQDAQRVEPLIGELIEKTFMLHYNFPPFSTGEVRMIRSVGRREIGHGLLAESSFYNVLPSKEEFPYTIRSISDILESNGSSSMATVCGTTMALMDGGVPIKEMIGGIAMGVIKDSSGKYHTLSDILGLEDAFGLMDFKITGSEKGIMAVQMDVKEKLGLPREVLESALNQALSGRLHILSEMKKVLAASRPQVSQRAPKIVFYKVEQDKIGMIIGPGGRNIKEIIATTGVEIDIDDDGTVRIYSKESKAADEALNIVKGIVGEVEIGSVYKGKVKRISTYGILVDLFPGKGGLVHISAIPKSLQRDLPKLYKIDSPMVVKVTGYDRETGRIRLIAPELQEKKKK